MDQSAQPVGKQSGKDCLSFDEFRRIVAQQLKVEEAKVSREASFVEDLLADSIQLVELMLRLEEAGIGIPLEEAWEVETVGDAYQLCKKHALTA